MATPKKTTKNGTKITVAKGTKAADVLTLITDILEESQEKGGNFYSKLVVVREEETGKVYLGKAFKTHIGLFTQSLHLPLETKVSRGAIQKS